jgi:hypothetical protein
MYVKDFLLNVHVETPSQLLKFFLDIVCLKCCWNAFEHKPSYLLFPCHSDHRLEDISPLIRFPSLISLSGQRLAKIAAK